MADVVELAADYRVLNLTSDQRVGLPLHCDVGAYDTVSVQIDVVYHTGSLDIMARIQTALTAEDFPLWTETSNQFLPTTVGESIVFDLTSNVRNVLRVFLIANTAAGSASYGLRITVLRKKKVS